MEFKSLNALPRLMKKLPPTLINPLVKHINQVLDIYYQYPSFSRLQKKNIEVYINKYEISTAQVQQQLSSHHLFVIDPQYASQRIAIPDLKQKPLDEHSESTNLLSRNIHKNKLNSYSVKTNNKKNNQQMKQQQEKIILSQKLKKNQKLSPYQDINQSMEPIRSFQITEFPKLSSLPQKLEKNILEEISDLKKNENLNAVQIINQNQSTEEKRGQNQIQDKFIQLQDCDDSNNRQVNQIEFKQNNDQQNRKKSPTTQQISQSKLNLLERRMKYKQQLKQSYNSLEEKQNEKIEPYKSILDQFEDNDSTINAQQSIHTELSLHNNQSSQQYYSQEIESHSSNSKVNDQALTQQQNKDASELKEKLSSLMSKIDSIPLFKEENESTLTNHSNRQEGEPNQSPIVPNDQLLQSQPQKYQNQENESHLPNLKINDQALAQQQQNKDASELKEKLNSPMNKIDSISLFKEGNQSILADHSNCQKEESNQSPIVLDDQLLQTQPQTVNQEKEQKGNNLTQKQQANKKNEIQPIDIQTDSRQRNNQKILQMDKMNEQQPTQSNQQKQKPIQEQSFNEKELSKSYPFNSQPSAQEQQLKCIKLIDQESNQPNQPLLSLETTGIRNQKFLQQKEIIEFLSKPLSIPKKGTPAIILIDQQGKETEMNLKVFSNQDKIKIPYDSMEKEFNQHNNLVFSMINEINKLTYLYGTQFNEEIKIQVLDQMRLSHQTFNSQQQAFQRFPPVAIEQILKLKKMYDKKLQEVFPKPLDKEKYIQAHRKFNQILEEFKLKNSQLQITKLEVSIPRDNETSNKIFMSFFQNLEVKLPEKSDEVIVKKPTIEFKRNISNLERNLSIKMAIISSKFLKKEFFYDTQVWLTLLNRFTEKYNIINYNIIQKYNKIGKISIKEVDEEIEMYNEILSIANTVDFILEFTEDKIPSEIIEQLLKKDE